MKLPNCGLDVITQLYIAHLLPREKEIPLRSDSQHISDLLPQNTVGFTSHPNSKDQIFVVNHLVLLFLRNVRDPWNLPFLG